MSTRDTLAYEIIKKTEEFEIHIYHEDMDNSYYIEINGKCSKIPEEIAKKFAETIKNIKVVNDE